MNDVPPPCVFGSKKSRCLAKRTAQRFFKKEHPAGGVSERLPSNFWTPPHRLDWDGSKNRLGTLSERLSCLVMGVQYAANAVVRTEFASYTRQTSLTTGLAPQSANFIDWEPIEAQLGLLFGQLRLQLYKII